MIKLFTRLRSRTAAFLHDLFMVPVAWFGAYWLRFNLETIPESFWQRALALLPLILFIHAIMFLYFGLYRGIWRFASMHDFMRILKAVITAVATCSVTVFLLTGMETIPRSVFILHALLLLALLGMPRFLYRWIKDHKLNYKPSNRVLIVGAGRAGEALVRELLQYPDGDFCPVAFVDDNPRKLGTEVRGLRVVDRCKAISRVVTRYSIDIIFIAIPSASTTTLRHIVGYCEASGKPFRILPRMTDLLSGRAILQELRDVSIEDLLGRESVLLDWATMRRGLSGRTVLISGGGGSIGSELCRQVAQLGPTTLVILEHNEFNLYQIDRELRAHFPLLSLHSHLCDVCDVAAVHHRVQLYRPEVIFHAAAYKHVPLLELQLREAVRNNLFGTVNMAKAADRHGCKTFVLISTDKAVNPANMMGFSKYLAEMYCHNFNGCSRAHFVIVRFGNVMDSAGSVIPLFRQQIREGGPVTVTHPDTSRYFMTIPEACQLILQSGAVGQGGEIYVLDMGTPINIRYLAEQMILLSGKTPGKDIAIEYIGLRPGEKLHEELFHREEELKPTPYQKMLLAQHRKLMDWDEFTGLLDKLWEACESYDEITIAALLEELIPEFQATLKPAELDMMPA